MESTGTISKLNKYGKCPCCGENWDGGSIAEYLLQRKKEGILYWADKPDAVIRGIVKDDYGSEHARFSKLEIADGVAKCQSCKQIFPGAEIDETYRKEILPGHIWNKENTEKIKQHIEKRKADYE